MIPSNIADLVTFVPNKTEPIHNWFYYKEGYARELILWLVKEYKLEGPIFDPFGGVGTTLLASKELGLESIGTDVSPLTVLATRVKTRDYDILALQKALDELGLMKPILVGKFSNKKIRELFRAENLDDIYFYFQEIKKIEDEKVRDLFLLALVDTTGRVANVIKTGGSLRKVKKPFLPVKKLFLGKIKKMIIDLEQTKYTGPEPTIVQEDARIFCPEENSIGAIITSPPYLNKIEYTSVYKMELGLFFDVQETRLRAFVSDSPNVEPRDGLPTIAVAYFDDMKKVMQNMFTCLKPKGKAFIIVAGGCLPDRAIESDDILIKDAKKIGFKLVDKIIARKINCMSMRTMRIGSVNESIIILEKP